MAYKMGSLFDGSGGFPLAGALCGVEPRWASEVDPYPIAVTRSRFPNMKHLGDISKINGGKIEPVDIITFGSPCQDLSVAGKRAGLKHEANGDEETTRSGLFMEAVRIIKEMRAATGGQYPRFALWENVPGAFSSQKGEDFRVVLEELIRIVEPRAVMPEVPKAGWAYADSYTGDGWSLAYRVFDAQYWGVPQRRRRIHLVVDFRGERAGEVLFEREGVRGYFETGRTPWQTTPADAQDCTGSNDREGASGGGAGGRGLDAVAYTLKVRTGVAVDSKGKVAGKGALIQTEKAATLATTNDQYLFQPICMATQQGGAEIRTDDKAPTTTAAAGMSGNNQPVVCLMDSVGGQAESAWVGEVSPTLKATHYHYKCPPLVTVPAAVCYDARGDGCKDQHLFENHSQDARYKGPLDVCPMLPAQLGTGGNNQPFVVEQTPFCKSARPKSKDDATVWKDARVSNTLNTFDLGEVRTNELVVGSVVTPIHDMATRYAGKRGDKADGKGNGLGVGNPGDPMNTLTSADRHAVAYATDVGWRHSIEEQSPTLLARQYKDPHLVAYGVDCRNGNETPELYPTLQAKPNGGQSLNFSGALHTQYIVRRLTPTECARLQGFADKWGHVEQKTALTGEEYRFWLDVRNTHAAINGRAARDYTDKQMLTWYNKLWTDSAEYKMWGNGIALPPALYCMQGIVDALETVEADDWMD